MMAGQGPAIRIFFSFTAHADLCLSTRWACGTKNIYREKEIEEDMVLVGGGFDGAAGVCCSMTEKDGAKKGRKQKIKKKERHLGM